MNKTAIITGASRGIGSAIAQTLAREGGYNVCINYRQSEDRALTLCERLKSEGLSAMIYKADVSVRSEVDEMVACVRNTFGPIDVLVNNAGISDQSLFQDITDEMWNRYLATNLSSAFYATQAVLPDMLRSHSGSIVNISSIWGFRGASCEVAYSCTKAAIIAMTRSLALELAPSGIRVNCVAPGVINTDMVKILSDETVEMLREETPVGRLGTPEDIANAVCFLASDKASFITGQVLCADGGFTV